MKADPDAKWPSTGQMIVLCQEYEKEYLLAIAPPKQKIKIPAKRERIQQIMRSEAGQHAIGAGYGPSFLDDVLDGEISVEDGLSKKYQDRRAMELRDRLRLADQVERDSIKRQDDDKRTLEIEGGDGSQGQKDRKVDNRLTGSVAKIVVALGRAAHAKNATLARMCQEE